MVVFAAVVGAIAWNLLTSYFGLPSSKQLWRSKGQAADAEWWGAVGDGRLAYSIYHYDGTETDRQLWIHNLRDKNRSVCTGSNDVLGMGEHWLIGGLSGTGNDVDLNKIAFFRL